MKEQENDGNRDNVYTVHFSQGDIAAVGNRVGALFAEEKYSLESGTKLEGLYGKGNHILRLLLGALAERYLLRVSIENSPAGVQVTVQKGMTGWSGGLIGIDKLKKEIKRMADKVQQLERN